MNWFFKGLKSSLVAAGVILAGLPAVAFAEDGRVTTPTTTVTATKPATTSTVTCAISKVSAAAAPAGTLQGFNFTGTGRDSANGALKVEWSFGGGADARISQNFNGSFTSSTGPIGFDLNGTFNVMLAVTNAAGIRCQAVTAVAVAPLPTGLPPKVSQQPAPGTTAAGNADYAVLPFNDLGMHCADIGSLPFSILPPFNTLNAQVIRKGTASSKPVLVDPSLTPMSLFYSAASSPNDPAGANSISSTAQNWPVGTDFAHAMVKKADFWDKMTDPLTGKTATVASLLFRGLNPKPDEGLQTNMNADHGRYMPGIGNPYKENKPQAFSTFVGAEKWFTAQGIPMTTVDDAGNQNSYPLMRVQALSPAGTVLATTDAVVPVSAEVDCRDCHTLGGAGADSSARVAGPAFVASISNNRYDKEHAAKINIVRLHDFKHQTKLEAGAPVVCAGCHRSNALATVGGPGGDPARQPMSAVMHGFHGKLMVDSSGKVVRDAKGEPVLSTTPAQSGAKPLVPTTGPMEGNCFMCHPGKITQCFRGVMRTAGVVCGDCHGDMLAVGGVFPLQSTGKARTAWADEPRCDSCHQGPGKVLTQAYATGDASATPVVPANLTYAGEPGKLYRDSHGHGGVACEGCHGSPHAIWPLGNPNANDNVTATELQGHTGKVAECTACHKAGSFSNGTLAGPHGLHPINDQSWTGHHGDFAKSRTGTDACAGCHGTDHLGTRLSKAQADRSFSIEGRAVAVKRGDIVGCGLCHSVQTSFGGG